MQIKVTVDEIFFVVVGYEVTDCRGLSETGVVRGRVGRARGRRRRGRRGYRVLVWRRVLVLIGAAGCTIPW